MTSGSVWTRSRTSASESSRRKPRCSHRRATVDFPQPSPPVIPAIMKVVVTKVWSCGSIPQILNWRTITASNFRAKPFLFQPAQAMFPTVDTKDAGAVEALVEKKFAVMYPGASHRWLKKIFRDMRQLFEG